MKATDPTANLDKLWKTSTLKFISEHARHHKVTPIITFDQPLWWNALMVRQSEPADSDLRQVVLRLGSFHTEMSFIGSIGHLIGESGLKELLELIYVPNAVEHILTGKAIARAVRAHLLLDAVINTLILSKALGVSIPGLEVEANAPDMNDARAEEKAIPGTPAFELQEAHALYADLMARKKSAEEVSSASAISKIKHLLQQPKESIQDNRSAKLWLQYMDMVDILRKSIKAERTGHWAQHLESLSEMLPYMATSGHILYTKSAQLYLQSMVRLESEHPVVYQKLIGRFHLVRRSDRKWAGLFTDFVIEQVLMRSMKTSGGLTRGRGMTEQQRLIKLLSMPVCAEINHAMLGLTGVSYSTGEQNKDISESRKNRDMKDTKTLLNALAEQNPFRL